eukprot:scaffold2042_cov123-Cylindrotheca_fusiformis.AAC.7
MFRSARSTLAVLLRHNPQPPQRSIVTLCRPITTITTTSPNETMKKKKKNFLESTPRNIPNVCQKSTIRKASVFSSSGTTTSSSTGWTKISKQNTREWHRDDFMHDATLAEKEAWLESLLSSSSSSYVDAQAFLVVLKTLAELQDNAMAPRRAEYWMQRLLGSSSQQQIVPTAECYQMAIQVWANNAHREHHIQVVVNRAERWLQEAIRHNKKKNNNNNIVTIECYNAFLDACTRGRSSSVSSSSANHKNKKRKKHSGVSMVERNALRADAILRQLHSRYHHHLDKKKNNNNNNHEEEEETTSMVVVPNTETFNFVIRGWTRCKNLDLMAHTKVLEWIRLMEAYQRNDPQNSNIAPNTKSYAMAMDSLVTVAKLKAQANNHETGLHEMEEAQAILSYMHDLYNAGVPGVVPNRVAYNILITGWAAMAKYQYHHHDNQAPFVAEEIMRKMITQKDNGFVEVAPDRITYEKVRRIWLANQNKNKTTKLVKYWCSAIATSSVILYYILKTWQVMEAWANSGHPNAGKRAMWWLKKMWNDSELDGGDVSLILPTKTTYNIVMRALLVEPEGALEAENLLLALGDKYKEEKDIELCPNSESFAIVIRAWLQTSERASNVTDRVQALGRAVEWLTSLREVENEKNLSTAPELYLRVLKCATRCAKGRREILELATDTFQGLRQSRFQLNSVPYCLMLQIGLDALSEDKQDMVHFVETLLADCSNDGLVSNRFVQTLARSDAFAQDWSSLERRELLDRLFPVWPLPQAWSRNIPSPRHHPRPSDLAR